MHTKPSVIRTHCTPLDTLLAGSTPGLSRQKRGKIKKIWCKMHHSCTISGRKPPQTRMRPPRFPLSCNHPPDGSCHRWRGGKAGEATTTGSLPTAGESAAIYCRGDPCDKKVRGTFRPRIVRVVAFASKV